MNKDKENQYKKTDSNHVYDQKNIPFNEFNTSLYIQPTIVIGKAGYNQQKDDRDLS